MPRRVPLYHLTREDLMILISAGKMCKEAALITGYDVASLYALAKYHGLRFPGRKPKIKPPPKRTRAHFYVSGRRGKAA